MKKSIKSLYTHFVNFAFPQICVACEKNQTETDSPICLECLWTLPRTESHISEDEILESKFWGKLKISGVYSFLKFSKRGKVQNLLHSIKYRNSPDLAEFLGRAYGLELRGSEFVDKIDFLIPVPLHSQRLKERGYNQAECLANGLASVLDVKVMPNALLRLSGTKSQTKTHGRFKRFENLENVFRLDVDKMLIKGKTVVLVDDVLTTGATLEIAGKQLLEAEVKELYIITLASVY